VFSPAPDTLKLLDGIEMAIDIGFDCLDCSGDMMLSDPPLSSDFNEEGKQDAFCNDCLHGFPKNVEEVQRTVETNYVNTVTNKKLVEILVILQVKNNLPYLKYVEKQESVQDIRNNCRSRRQLIDFLVDKYNENEDFIESRI